MTFAISGTLGISSNGVTYGLVPTDSGAVRLPFLPLASLTHSGVVTISGVETQLTSANFYDTTIINQGNCFNAATGRFTCPVDGIYRLFFRCTSSGALCNVRLRKNDIGINEAYGGGGTDLQTVSSEIVIRCVAGDFLNVQVNSLNTIGGTQHKQVTFQLLG